VSGGWITRADRARRQQAALALAAILADCDDLPLIVWTVGPAGGTLAGQVAGAGARAVFAAWQQALAMGDVLETPITGGSRLRSRGSRGGVRVTLTATVPAGERNRVTS
jgi:hypothetical protein